MNLNRYIIRTSGFAFYFFLLIGIAILFTLYLLIKDTVQQGVDIAKAFIFLLFVASEVFIYRFLTHQKIELTKEKLSVQLLQRAKLKFGVIPIFVKQDIPIGDIESITIAKIKYFEDNLEKFGSKALQDVISSYRNTYSVVVSDKVTFPIPLGHAARHVPLMFVKSKSGKENDMVVTTKPFSKNGFRELVSEFKTLNIPIFVESSLGL